MVLMHLRAHVVFAGSEAAAVRSFRRQLAWYAHGLRGAAAFRAQVNTLELASGVDAAARRFFSDAAADPHSTEEQDVDYGAALG